MQHQSHITAINTHAEATATRTGLSCSETASVRPDVWPGQDLRDTELPPRTGFAVAPPNAPRIDGVGVDPPHRGTVQASKPRHWILRAAAHNGLSRRAG